ncbi:DUF1801 domain-containing protein [Sphingomonas arenae]|uniref:DUF1801 domain-containing protein n=1 Tax=Sphingomonas arenae TaxID=2812555 RepID=UPI00196822FE
MARSSAATPDAYIAELDPARAEDIRRVRTLVNQALQPGFVERMAWGMICWEVPLELSGPTYNGQPLVYVSLAAQKNYNALYLNCCDASDERGERLRAAFEEDGKKFDMGKSCLRFRHAADLPEEAITAEIASTSAEDFAARYRSDRG